MKFPGWLTLVSALALQLSFSSSSGLAQDIDTQELLRLIEQSRQKKQQTPDQQKLGILRNLRIDRSPAGIFAASLAESRRPKENAAQVGPPPDPGKKPSTEQEVAAFGQEAETFRRDIILGRWENVRKFLEAQPPGISGEAYKIVLGKLLEPAQVAPQPEIMAQGAKPHSQPAFLPPLDWLGLAAAAPSAPAGDIVKSLARLLPRDPRPPQEFFDRLEEGVRYFGGSDPADRRRAAEILLEIGFVKEAGKFLPDPAAARAASDYAALNLIARHRAELARKDPKTAGKGAILEAWEISTSFITDPKAPIAARSEALFRALSLIPELRDERGKEWVLKTFQDPKGEGLELLASLGALTAQSRENPSENIRLEQLRLQSAAVKTLLSTPGIDPAKWSWIFNLYARQWTYEAGVTQSKDQSNSRRMEREFDDFGNVFYRPARTDYTGGGTRPIPAAKLLECRPEDAWLASLEATTRDECLVASTRLFLKVKEEDSAIALIKPIAAKRSDQAVSLAREVIRVWTENHNPNEETNYRSRYMFFYGFNNQAGSIPLTRSKQDRNLVELATLVKSIRSLGLEESFDKELADAFISCHSKAEVWKIESIESVFGAADVLDASTLSSLVERMRQNLAGLWPNPQLQQAYKTKRKDKELQQQILQGYAAAEKVTEDALAKKPADSWRLANQLAALKFEESNYRNSIAPENTHSSVKRASLDAMAAAAAGYSAALSPEDSKKESQEVFLTWFYAALGSPTLEALKSYHVPAPAEYPKIKAALDKLPKDARERHLAGMAATINTRLANVPPDLKMRYLEAADLVLGKRQEMGDASNVLAYYRDLVKEIELVAQLDGTDRIQPGVPFGLFVNLRHTREIERESGGFQRYLQNQTASQFAFNFGRPPEDYRDKFEKAARAVLEENFEVLSLTFHSEKVESRTDPELGWRVTPYAYFLLKPKGPQVDKIPPLKIDLDFTDTSGYVILPIASSEIPVDASGKADPRPFRDLRITETLDERSLAEKGRVFLEIKATAHGLVPRLEDIVDNSYPGFKTGTVEDHGVRVSELDAETDELAAVSEAEWRVELLPDGGNMPATFRFPKAKVATVDKDGFVLQRYEDVDLVAVGPEVPLNGRVAQASLWLPAAVILLFGLLGGIGFVIRKRRRKAVPESGLEPLPSQLTPVTVLGYLRKLRQKAPAGSANSGALDQEIQSLEAGYFGPEAMTPDRAVLREIAERWQRKIPVRPA